VRQLLALLAASCVAGSLLDAQVGYCPPRAQQDKEWLAADMTPSPFRGSVYMTWTEFDKYASPLPGDSSRILFSRSTDRGATWSAPVRISDQGGDCLDGDNTVEGAVPAVGHGGEVYVSWSGPLGIMFDRSTDGGATLCPLGRPAERPGGLRRVDCGLHGRGRHLERAGES